MINDFDRAIQRFIDQTQRQKRPAVQFQQRGWRPAVDVFETEDMVVAVVELAGVDESALDISVEDRALAIRGQRERISPHQPRSYQLMEIHRGAFERVVPLPAPVDPDRTQASIRSGMLEVCMPKAKPQRISINVSSEQSGGR
ncbi:MAG TPA: Hsp20/alpha crystallin family protein [Chloroflexota bacterium]|nr:Hsp20/alpha crystallin family protein [Chloroflexota bacterium]